MHREILIEALKNTLNQIERDVQREPSRQDLQELKRSILLAIAELDAEDSNGPKL